MLGEATLTITKGERSARSNMRRKSPAEVETLVVNGITAWQMLQ